MTVVPPLSHLYPPASYMSTFVASLYKVATRMRQIPILFLSVTLYRKCFCFSLHSCHSNSTCYRTLQGDVPTRCPALDTRPFLVQGILIKAAVNICGRMPLPHFISSSDKHLLNCLGAGIQVQPWLRRQK